MCDLKNSMKISLLQFSDALINNRPLYRPFSDFTLSLSSISYTEAVEILKQASQNFTFTPEVVYIYENFFLIFVWSLRIL